MLDKIIVFLLLLFECLQKSDVYYTKHITPQGVVEIFKKLNITLPGKVGLKVHTF